MDPDSCSQGRDCRGSRMMHGHRQASSKELSSLWVSSVGSLGFSQRLFCKSNLVEQSWCQYTGNLLAKKMQRMTMTAKTKRLTEMRTALRATHLPALFAGASGSLGSLSELPSKGARSSTSSTGAWDVDVSPMSYNRAVKALRSPANGITK
jgi:hypothetical protein